MEEGRCREGEFCENAIVTAMSYRAGSRQDQNQVNKQGKVRKSSSKVLEGHGYARCGWKDLPAQNMQILSVCVGW